MLPAPNPINDKADLHTKLSLQVIHQAPYEMEIYHKNDSYRRFRTTETPIKDGDGNVVAAEGGSPTSPNYKKTERRLRDENLLLRSSMWDRIKFHDIVGNCEAMKQVIRNDPQGLGYGGLRLQYGESGQAVHSASDRKEGNFVALNCGAIPDNLIESEFFGVQKGVYTGANADKKGYLETAGGETLFLDEIGEISPAFQVKFRRAVVAGYLSFTKTIHPDIHQPLVGR